MTICIELWIDGTFTDGAETWWDAFEAALATQDESNYPLLHRVDPYGNVAFRKDELEPLIVELRSFKENLQRRPAQLIEKLIRLCSLGSVAHQSRLLFLGD